MAIEAKLNTVQIIPVSLNDLLRLNDRVHTFSKKVESARKSPCRNVGKCTFFFWYTADTLGNTCEGSRKGAWS